MIDSRLNSGDLLGYFIRNFGIEFFFQRHYQFNGIQESAPGSSTLKAAFYHVFSLTPSCSMMIFFTRSSMLLLSGLNSLYVWLGSDVFSDVSLQVTPLNPFQMLPNWRNVSLNQNRQIDYTMYIPPLTCGVSPVIWRHHPMPRIPQRQQFLSDRQTGDRVPDSPMPALLFIERLVHVGLR